MTIRSYTDGDYQSIVNIYAESKLDELRFEREEFEFLPLERDEQRRLALFKSEIYVFERERVLGYGAILGAEIRALFVLPGARGRGVGRSLLEYMLSKATGSVSLNVAKSNLPAINLYQRYNFELGEEFDVSYNGKTVMAVKMTRPGW